MIDKVLLDNLVENFDFNELFISTTEYVSKQLKEKITVDTLAGIDSFYLTGCGDSLFEAFAVQGVFEKYTGVRTEVLEALEFTKYRAGFIPDGSAVFCISNSGGASRTVESVKVANDINALSIAVSGSEKSPLAENARLLIHRPVPQFPNVLGNCNRVVRNMAEYVVSIHVLNMIALHIAELKGRISFEEHSSLLRTMLEQPDNILHTARENSGAIADFVEKYRAEKAVFFLGAGPNYATALFGCAKLHEDVPVNGICEWLEEWAHLQYFLSLNEEHKTPIAVIAAPGKSHARAQEIIASARRMDVPVLELRSADDESPVTAGTTALKVYDSKVPELFSPSVYCTVLQLLGIYWALELGAQSVPLSRADDYELIRGSKIEVDYMK